MADGTWTGAVDGSLSTAGNWDNLPGNGDAAFFPATVTNPPTTDMDGLVDTLTLIHVASGATYDIGSSGNEMKVKATKVVNLGRGAFWYATDGNTADHNIILAPAAGGSSNLLLSASTTGGQVYCMAGVISITGTGATELIYVGRMEDREPTVTIASGVGITDLMDQYAGSCITNNVLTVLQLSGGRHEKLDTQEAVTVRQTGGTMIYDATDAVTRYEGQAGEVDFTRRGRALTVATFVESPNIRLVRSKDLTTFTAHIEIAKVQ